MLGGFGFTRLGQLISTRLFLIDAGLHLTLVVDTHPFLVRRPSSCLLVSFADIEGIRLAAFAANFLRSVHICILLHL